MTEKILSDNFKHNQFKEEEFEDLQSHAIGGVDTMSPQQRKRLVEYGYHFLNDEKNEYKAMVVFEAVQDFEGLRKVADSLLSRQLGHYLFYVFNLLEDHEGIRKLLNRDDASIDGYVYTEAFRSLKNKLDGHVEKFLHENSTPVATGMINGGIDLIAIYNLAQEYDIAVPIARGGLNQGAIASLWGMPTKIIDISAHNKKVAKGKWVNSVLPEDFNGKKVLLFDKDAVSGASVNKALNMLKRFKTADIGIYFAHNAIRPGSVGIGTLTEGLPPELKTFYPNTTSFEGAGDIYMKAHEKLGTLYGRRRQIERLFIDESQKLQKQFPELAEAFSAFALKQFESFDSLNPNLPGISAIREKIISRAHKLFKDHKGYLKDNLYISYPITVDNFKKALLNVSLLDENLMEELIRARYEARGKEAAKKRGVENPHYPVNILASFATAQKAVKDGFDIALIIGPEGFFYEPYFNDLGMPTVAVNIPESEENKPRTIKLFDDLSVLQGKKVLVVEDDIRTGATLQKVLEQLDQYNLKSLGLYLGQPEVFQEVMNIPKDFEKIYLAEYDPNAAKEFEEYLLSKGLKIFKTMKAPKQK